MQNTNFVRNNYLLWFVKIIAALFQVPATFHVFKRLFIEAGRPEAEAIFTTLCAIFLIDAFFLLVLYFLESDELTLDKKIPWAIAGIFLVISTLVIGFIDEGVLAFAPRIVFILLIVTDLITLITDWRITYNSREAQEQRIRNAQVLKRKKVMKDAWEGAIKDLKPEIKELQRQRELKTLGLLDEIEETPIKEIVEAEELPEGIIQLEENEYAWTDRFGEVHATTATGKPYSLKGAMVAYARKNKNGVNN